MLGFSRSFAVSCAALVVSLAWPGCGSKSGLGLSGFDAGPPAAQICARSELRSGYRDVALYVLLDRSESIVAGKSLRFRIRSASSLRAKPR